MTQKSKRTNVASGAEVPQPPRDKEVQLPTQEPDTEVPTPDTDVDKRRDEELKETFPASDPVPATGGGVSPAPKSKPDAVERDLDHSLKETFPASDPPAIVDPDHKKPKPK